MHVQIFGLNSSLKIARKHFQKDMKGSGNLKLNQNAELLMYLYLTMINLNVYTI